ncbi:MAG: hypothetical protein HOJ88_06575 [Proteobacteria bacterium]|jgi:hypothetical protein|nr:hypothetical protein [Pseudomonadota bacterium]
MCPKDFRLSGANIPLFIVLKYVAPYGLFWMDCCGLQAIFIVLHMLADNLSGLIDANRMMIEGI